MNFSHRCAYEYRTGETCGMKLVNNTYTDWSNCRLCERIATKYRRRAIEVERLDRWQREGGTLIASMERCRQIIADLDREIHDLQHERVTRQRSLQR